MRIRVGKGRREGRGRNNDRRVDDGVKVEAEVRGVPLR
jgi:hypothetical protein